MKEQPLSSKMRREHTICCYKLDVDVEQHEEPKHFFERMPMLGRGIASGIKFKNVQHHNRQPIYQLLNDLYQNSNPSAIYHHLASKRINPIIHGGHERQDLEYYIPQIVTFMVLQKNLEDEELLTFLLKGCSTDFFFAHRVYFYLKSLTEDNSGQRIASVCQFLEERFVFEMNLYRNAKLSGIQFTKSMLLMDHDLNTKNVFGQPENHITDTPILTKQVSQNNELAWQRYGTKHYPNPLPLNPPSINKVKRKAYCQHGFMQTPTFWDDLLNIGNMVCKVQPDNRVMKLNRCLMEVNQRLPANVYIPFFKEEIRLYTVLTVWKGRLFATNTRAPYSIWVEMYREEEELNLEKVLEVEEEEENVERPKKNKKNILKKIYETISKPFSISGDKNTLNFKKFLTQKLAFNGDNEEKKPSLSKSKHKNKSIATHSFVEDNMSRRLSISEIYEQRQRQVVSEGRESVGSRSFGSSISSMQDDLQMSVEQRMKEFFGPKSSQIIQEVREHSIYRELKSWRLVHLMIKTGDDIKQEQFAMQLINRFQYAFTKQNVDCVVFPYEVISLGPDSGIIQMLNDITTLNSLFQKLYNKGMTLRQFFQKIFPDPVKARKNFMRSLAGYSILTYFLQVKDRHNGNILLSREGYIMHIDFGFFLSNAPGKGVQLQKKVPFKLLTEYVEVIGELDSQQFFQFRQLFYRGFRAVLKQKEAILTLVKMMYSSHMESMGCFIKGQFAIVQLQQRFAIEQGVQNFCYNLINSSLDNWRARWYDKFQYFLQKIYY